MSEEDQSGEPEGGGWAASAKTLGAVGGLGIEFAAFVVVGALVGRWVDAKLGVAPAGVLIGVAAAGAAIAAHVRYVLASLREPEEADEGEGDEQQSAGGQGR